MRVNLSSWTELLQKSCAFAQSLAVTLLGECSSGHAVSKKYSRAREGTKVAVRMISSGNGFHTKRDGLD